jgi:hypothetical protein
MSAANNTDKSTLAEDSALLALMPGDSKVLIEGYAPQALLADKGYDAIMLGPRSRSQ